VLTVVTDHDVRNPAGLIAIERISQRIMSIPDVRMVQSASRPAGRVPDEATLRGQAGIIGRQLHDAFDSVSDRLSLDPPMWWGVGWVVMTKCPVVVEEWDFSRITFGHNEGHLVDAILSHSPGSLSML
jgi:hypothetical protein